MSGSETMVLVVDDEDSVRDLHRDWLTDEYAVRTAATGHQAVEALDPSIDVVLLDRDMPELDGLETAEHIRDRPVDTHVVMVSAMAADFDIVDYPVDDYLQKPVSETELRGAVRCHEEQRAYQESLDEYFELTTKLARIEAETDPAALEDDAEYRELRERVSAKAAEVDEALTTEETDWSVAFNTTPEDRGVPSESTGEGHDWPGSAG